MARPPHRPPWTGAPPGQYPTLTLHPNGTYTTHSTTTITSGVVRCPLTETFTYTYTTDGDPATGSVTITITGTEDQPIDR